MRREIVSGARVPFIPGIIPLDHTYCDEDDLELGASAATMPQRIGRGVAVAVANAPARHRPVPLMCYEVGPRARNNARNQRTMVHVWNCFYVVKYQLQILLLSVVFCRLRTRGLECSRLLRSGTPTGTGLFSQNWL
jgi:hypothetical protein